MTELPIAIATSCAGMCQLQLESHEFSHFEQLQRVAHELLASVRTLSHLVACA